MTTAKKRRAKVETQRISNILTGVLMHLKVVHSHGDSDLEGPINAISDIVRHIDDGDSLP